MPYYINANGAADYFAALRRKLPHDSKDFLTRDEMLLNAEQLFRISAGMQQIFCWDSIQIGECDGCKWRNRYQKCSCCRRNRGLKDNYEEATK